MPGFNQISEDETFYLPDVISGIVTSIQTDSKPYFRWGYWKEIVDIMNELSKHQTSTVAMFPMVYLSLLYEADKLNNRVTNAVDFDLFIIAESKREYSSTERLTTIFKGIIDPIYDNLITAFLNNKWFGQKKRELPHREINIFKAGAEDINKNKLDQIIDAKHLSFKNIEIINLKIY